MRKEADWALRLPCRSRHQTAKATKEHCERITKEWVKQNAESWVKDTGFDVERLEKMADDFVKDRRWYGEDGGTASSEWEL